MTIVARVVIDTDGRVRCAVCRRYVDQSSGTPLHWSTGLPECGPQIDDCRLPIQ